MRYRLGVLAFVFLARGSATSAPFQKNALADTCNVSSVGVVTGAYQRHAGGSGQSAAVVAGTEITFSSARHVYPRYAANDES